MKTYSAIIEIPKGDDRRRHLNHKGADIIDLGPIKDKIPVNGGIMPIDYGYLENTITTEGDEVDVLVVSSHTLRVGEKIDVRPIAFLERDDGDHKVVAADAGEKSVNSWEDIFHQHKAILDFFGYQKNIIVFDDPSKAIAFIEHSQARIKQQTTPSPDQ